MEMSSQVGAKHLLKDATAAAAHAEERSLPSPGTFAAAPAQGQKQDSAFAAPGILRLQSPDLSYVLPSERTSARFWDCHRSLTCAEARPKGAPGSAVSQQSASPKGPRSLMPHMSGRDPSPARNQCSACKNDQKTYRGSAVQGHCKGGCHGVKLVLTDHGLFRPAANSLRLGLLPLNVPALSCETLKGAGSASGRRFQVWVTQGFTTRESLLKRRIGNG